MQCVHERGVGQRLRPNHCSRPNQEPPHDAGHAKPKTLRGKDEEHLEAPAKVLLVKDLLCQKNVGSVSHTSLDGDVGHHDNHGVFLDVEGAWVEIPCQAKGVELAIGKNLDSKNVNYLLNIQKDWYYLPWHRNIPLDKQEAERHRHRY